MTSNKEVIEDFFRGHVSEGNTLSARWSATYPDRVLYLRSYAIPLAHFEISRAPIPPRLPIRYVVFDLPILHSNFRPPSTTTARHIGFLLEYLRSHSYTLVAASTQFPNGGAYREGI